LSDCRSRWVRFQAVLPRCIRPYLRPVHPCEFSNGHTWHPHMGDPLFTLQNWVFFEVDEIVCMFLFVSERSALMRCRMGLWNCFWPTDRFRSSESTITVLNSVNLPGLKISHISLVSIAFLSESQIHVFGECSSELVHKCDFVNKGRQGNIRQRGSLPSGQSYPTQTTSLFPISRMNSAEKTDY
jgi:hypothetical protein